MPSVLTSRRPHPLPRSTPRNPLADSQEHRAVVRLARAVASELDPGHRAAWVLAGSWARGDAHAASDVDLWLIGPRERETALERGGRIVSVRFATPEGERRAFRSPARWSGAVPGWRAAAILDDPRGVAARLRSEARRFRWKPVRGLRDAYLGRQLVGWAEEVTKLLRALETGERETAAAQRNLLAGRMAFLRSLELEYLYGSENGLWEEVGRRAGPDFATAQRAAFGTARGSWSASCEGALRLYALTARACWKAVRPEQQRIVGGVCRRAGYPVAGDAIAP